MYAYVIHYNFLFTSELQIFKEKMAIMLRQKKNKKTMCEDMNTDVIEEMI